MFFDRKVLLLGCLTAGILFALLPMAPRSSTAVADTIEIDAEEGAGSETGSAETPAATEETVIDAEEAEASPTVTEETEGAAEGESEETVEAEEEAPTSTPTVTFTLSPTSTATSFPPTATMTPVPTAVPTPTLEPEPAPEKKTETDVDVEATGGDQKAKYRDSKFEDDEWTDDREEKETQSAPSIMAASKPTTAVNVSKSTGFDYLMRAGLVVRKSSMVQRVGTVIGGPRNDDISFTAPKRIYVKLRKRTEVKIGDRWVIFRFGQPVTDPSNREYLGVQVLNLGVGLVLEVQGSRCLVQLEKSYLPIQKGDEARPYEEELERWNQSRRMEKLPGQEVLCSVCGGEPSKERYVTSDYVILSAGSEQGVVAGQVFILREREAHAEWNGPAEAPVGRVKVFYVGPDYSIAKVLMSSIPITRGIRALYQP